MPHYRASIEFEDAANHEALERLGKTHEFTFEAADDAEALEKASAMAIEKLAVDLYPPEPAFCAGCEGTTPEPDGNCPDCGGNEWLPPMTPQIVMAWAEGQDWEVKDVLELPSG